MNQLLKSRRDTLLFLKADIEDRIAHIRATKIAPLQDELNKVKNSLKGYQFWVLQHRAADIRQRMKKARASHYFFLAERLYFINQAIAKLGISPQEALELTNPQRVGKRTKEAVKPIQKVLQGSQWDRLVIAPKTVRLRYEKH